MAPPRERSLTHDLPAGLRVDVRLSAAGVSVTVHGDLDLHTAPGLRERLLAVVAQGEPRVEVHLDGVGFMDSTALGVLVGALEAQRAAGGELELVCSRPRHLRLIEVTGLDRVFTVHAGEPA